MVKARKPGNEPPLVICCPAKGRDYLFGEKRHEFRASEHDVVVMQAHARFDPGGEFLASILSRIRDRLGFRILAVQLDDVQPVQLLGVDPPAGWREVRRGRYNILWCLDTWEAADFASFFDRIHRHDQWYVFLVSGERGEPPYFPVELKMLDSSVLRKEYIWWDAFVCLDGDLGSFLCFLPERDGCDSLLIEFVRDGIARW